MKGSNTGGNTIPGTTSGYITCVEDAHDSLKESFPNGWDGLQRSKSKSTVNEFKFFK